MNDKVMFAGSQVTLNDDPYLSITLTLFCAGCNFKCKGCHSEVLQKAENGKPTEIYQLSRKIDDHIGLIDTVCFCGGEWTLYEIQLLNLASHAKLKNLKTILYTGCLYENLSEDVKKVLDIIVDGQYKQKLAQDIFPASSNQRVFVKGIQVNSRLLPVNLRKY